MLSYVLYFGVFGFSILMCYLYQNRLKSKYNVEKKLSTSNRICKCSFVSSFEWIWILLIIALPVVIATFRYGIGTDYYEYDYLFRMYGFSNFIKPVKLPIEYGYYLINYISGIIFKNFSGVLFLSSLIIMMFVLFFLKRFKDKISICFAIFIFYMTLYPATYNAIRQMIAVAIVMYAYNFATERNFVKYALLIILASLFHKTALICLSWYIFGMKTEDELVTGFKRFLLNFGLIAVVLLMPVVLNFVSNISIFSEYFTNYSVSSNAKVLKQLLLLFPILIPIIFMSKKLKVADKRNEFYIFLFMIQIVCIFFGTYYEWIFRLTYYAVPAQYVLIPSMVSIIKDKWAKIIMKFYFICFYIIYFIYTYAILGNDGIFPYQIMH